ncbi:hypothetical protein [Paenisporosarcina sp. NPDC076898]|uniref:hypothetical protein n=1 Tax=unclassified Paenisporosarcina TaxID=2642018 RepID=UPI003CFF916A
MFLIALLKPLKNYEDYVYRAYAYLHIFQKQKAIATMEQAVIQPHFSIEERSSGYIYLGILHSKMKNYQIASDYYHLGFRLVMDKPFSYRSPFKQAIETFIKSGDEERAKYWLSNLLERQSYDKNFRKLSVLQKILY